VGNLLLLGFQGLHDQCLFLGRTDIGAIAATGTVKDAHLDAEVQSAESSGRSGLPQYHSLRGIGRFRLIEQERPDGSVRTYVGTLVTLDTIVGDPFRDRNGNTTFFIGCRSGEESSVFISHKRGNRKVIALLGVHHVNQAADVFRPEGEIRLGNNRFDIFPFRRNGHFHHIHPSRINGSIVHVHNLLALPAVSIQDGALHLFHGQFERDHVGDSEESRLHDGVGAVAQPQVNPQLCPVDDIEVDLVVSEILLHFIGKPLFGLFSIPQ